VKYITLYNKYQMESHGNAASKKGKQLSGFYHADTTYVLDSFLPVMASGTLED
jgi:hypothetical protein